MGTWGEQATPPSRAEIIGCSAWGSIVGLDVKAKYDFNLDSVLDKVLPRLVAAKGKPSSIS